MHFSVNYHEIGLKGKNRAVFENQLIRNIKIQLREAGVESVSKKEGRILVSVKDENAALRLFGFVFGVSSFRRVRIVPREIEELARAAIKLASEKDFSSGTFAVRAKRSSKQFELTSEEINKELGRVILKEAGGIVNLKNPEHTLRAEILSKEAFVSAENLEGPGGLPVGSSGRVLALLSGGIDSPLAAWKMMKRGCETVFLHFHSYPHTSRQSILKVKKLARLVGRFQPKTILYLVPFAEAQREVVMKTSAKYRVILYRRLMMRIASAIAKNEAAPALVTGESVGQVASQTISNLRAVEAAADLPVFRPLAGDDKQEIVDKAIRVGTYETSIEPHDDCCTLFIPKNPATGSRIDFLEKEEENLEIEKIKESCVNSAEKVCIP